MFFIRSLLCFEGYYVFKYTLWKKTQFSNNTAGEYNEKSMCYKGLKYIFLGADFLRQRIDQKFQDFCKGKAIPVTGHGGR
jgi:hypothetical protein